MAATTEPFPLIDRILAFEQGEISAADYLDLFAHLVRTGQAWTLQGFYGRTAAGLIDSGFITPEGEIAPDALERLED